MKIAVLSLISGLVLPACASAPKPAGKLGYKSDALVLPDKVHFLQTDKKWANKTLGGSGASIKKDGCLVTAAAMALYNLGFKTDPGALAKTLKKTGGFNKRGHLVWQGLEKATGGRAQTVFTHYKDDGAIRACLKAGYYPLVRFSLPSSRTHWAMVTAETEAGFYIRDPAYASKTPIPLSMRTGKIDALRCIGIKA